MNIVTKTALAILLAASFAALALGQAPDDPLPPSKSAPAAGKTKAGDKMDVGEDMERITEALPATQVRHLKNRVSVFLTPKLLAVGWAKLAEGESKTVYKEEYAEAEKAKKPFVQEVTVVTLTSYKNKDAFNGIVVTFTDWKGVERLIDFNLPPDPALTKDTAALIERRIDNETFYTRFLVSRGRAAPPGPAPMPKAGAKK